MWQALPTFDAEPQEKMNRIIIGIVFTWVITLSACTDNTAAVKMAEEICNAMDKYDHSDPLSMYHAANDLYTIRKNVSEYGSVTDTQLKKIMTRKCPEGWTKYATLKDK
jgi:hypothetical protein